MEQLIVVLVFAAIALLNRWLSKGKSGESEEEAGGQSAEQAAKQRADRQQAEEERVRKFMEALGVPKESLPPTRQARAQPPPLPIPKTSAPPTPAGRPTPDFEHQRLPEIRPPHPARELQPRREPAVRRATVAVEEVLPRPALPPPVPSAPAPAKRPATSAPPPTPRELEVSSPRSSLARVTDQPDLRSLLRARQSIRNAVLLREILGPPRALELSVHDPMRRSW